MSNSSQKAREVMIIVNGEQKTVPKEEISFTEIIALAFNPVPTGPNMVFTVTFRRGHGEKPEGTLTEGGSVKAKEGMVFNVTATDKS